MIYIFCGSRDWTDVDVIWNIMSKVVDKDDVVIHGGATGADCISELCALTIGCEVVRMNADWETFGKAAGPIRNAEMLEKLLKLMKKHETDGAVYAFHPFITNSKGTRDMVRRAMAVEIPTHIISGATP